MIAATNQPPVRPYQGVIVARPGMRNSGIDVGPQWRSPALRAAPQIDAAREQSIGIGRVYRYDMRVAAFPLFKRRDSGTEHGFHIAVCLIHRDRHLNPGWCRSPSVVGPVEAEESITARRRRLFNARVK